MKAVKSGSGYVIKKVVEACFVAGTLVETSNGLISIEQIKRGDLVWSRHEENLDYGYRPVVSTVKFESKQIYEIIVQNENGQRESYQTTEEHPFWVDGSGWIPASALVKGMKLVNRNNELLTVVNQIKLEKTDTVYNITVDEFHTYHVGEFGTWVHNLCSPRFAGASDLTLHRLDTVLANATDTTTGSGVRNYTQVTGRSRMADYAWLTANPKRVIKNDADLKITELQDGTKVILRNSSTGPKTIEIQKPSGGKVMEIRYATL